MYIVCVPNGRHLLKLRIESGEYETSMQLLEMQ